MLYDVSEGGMALDILGPRPASDLVVLNFDLPEIGEHFEAKGKVTWVREPENRVGLRFVDLTADAHRKIKLWLIKKAVVEDILRYSMPPLGGIDSAAPLQAPVRTPEKIQAPANLRATEVKLAPVLPAEPAIRREPKRPAAKAPEVHAAPPIAAPADLRVNELRSSFSQAETRAAAEPNARIETARAPLDREILKKWITIATVAFLFIVSLAVAKWIYTTPALDKISSGSFSDILSKAFNIPSDKSQAGEVSNAANANASKDGRAARREPKTSQRNQAKRANAGAQNSSPRPTQFEIMNAQNGRTIVPSETGTATPASNKPATVKLAEVSGGQPASGSLMQEPGGTKVGLVMLHPSTDVPENKVLPEYPALALQKNVQGRVVLRALIAKDGSLQNVRLVGPPSLLSAPVLEAVKSWRYQPRSQNGVPVEVETQITIDFEINAR